MTLKFLPGTNRRQWSMWGALLMFFCEALLISCTWHGSEDQTSDTVERGSAASQDEIKLRLRVTPRSKKDLVKTHLNISYCRLPLRHKLAANGDSLHVWVKTQKSNSNFFFHYINITQITALPLGFSWKAIIQIAHCTTRARICTSILLHLPNKCLITCVQLDNVATATQK